MSIALTCPECSAEFNVQDNLAGKTIRCSTCKTEMKVPAAKKAFGHGNSDSTSEEGPELLSIDDDNNTQTATKPTKVSKPVPPPAKVAAKKQAVKTDVSVDDEDEEDEAEEKIQKKTNPNRASSKLANKASAKRRQDDDDEDDDDDEEDRPKKKKKKAQQGGSGMVIAIVGVGVLALAGIGGVVAWQMNKDDKKESTASTDNDNKPTMPMPRADRAGRPGGPEGPGGSGEPGGTMPGKRGPGPGGGAIGSGLSGEDVMKLMSLLDKHGVLGVPGNWESFSGDGFTAEFPGKPGTKTEKSAVLTAVVSADESVAAVVMLPFDAATLANVGNDPKQVLELFYQGMAKGELGKKKVKDFSVQGFHAKEIDLTESDGAGTMRLIMVKDRLYIGLVGSSYKNGKPTMPGESVSRFLNSIKFTDTGSPGNSGNVARGPEPVRPGTGPMPGGGPRPIQPGGGPMPIQPGGGPTGGPMPIQPGGGPMPIQPGGGPTGGPMPIQPGGGPKPIQPGGGPMPIQPGGGPTGGPMPIQPGGGPMPVQPGGGPTPVQPGGGPMPVQPGGGTGPAQPAANPGQPGPQPGAGPGVGQPPNGQPGRGPNGQPGRGPNGGQPGRLPGGGPGMGNNTGANVDPNPPPQGAIIDGNQEKKLLDTFFTAAFDVEHKAFFAITSRTDKSKVVGTLLWYDYPDFNRKGSYHIPHLGTRMAMDSAKGLLYVATANTVSQTSTVMQQQFDLPAALGDVQVFEVSPTALGAAGSDLKPLATIAVGKVIRGLELSEDGKFLYVAATTPAKPITSTLMKIDTETHKSINSQTLKEAIWEMRKSADGKSLVILDGIQGADKDAKVRIYNPESMKEEKVFELKGVANHLASVPGSKRNRIAATVSSTAAPVAGKAPAAKLAMTGDDGTADMDLGPLWKASANGPSPGYIEFAPDGKMAFMSGFRSSGIDMYELPEDADAISGWKKKASIRTAKGEMIGGHFLISPDGLYLIDHHGIVIKTSNVGGSNGESTAVAGQSGIGLPAQPQPGPGVAPVPGPGQPAPGPGPPPGRPGRGGNPEGGMPPGGRPGPGGMPPAPGPGGMPPVPGPGGMPPAPGPGGMPPAPGPGSPK